MTRLSGTRSAGPLFRKVALAGLLLGAAGACESYLGPDGAMEGPGALGERPVLTALEFRPDTVLDVTPGEAGLTLSVGARFVEGVEGVTVTLQGPAGETRRSCATDAPVEGDATEGRWACSSSFQVHDPLGTWTLDQVRIRAQDTTATFGADVLRDAGYRTGFRLRRDPARVVSLEVAPGLDTLDAAGAVLALEPTAVNQYGETMESADLAWSSTAPQVAGVDGQGRVVALRPGTAGIVARAGEEADTAEVVVDFDLVLASVRVTPDSAVMARPGALASFQAEALSQIGEPLPGEHPAAWTVADTSVATVSPEGVVTARAPGETLVEARIGDQVGRARLLVRSEPARLLVTPPRDTVPEGGMVRLFATVFDAFNTELDVPVDWSVSDTALARVDSTGVVTGIQAGQVHVAASAGELRDSARVLVVERVPGQVLVKPSTDTVSVGGVARFQARVLDQLGQPLDAPVDWHSRSPEVAEVSGTGIATGLAPGTATLVARAGDVSATATLVVEGDAPEGVRWINPEGGLWSVGGNWEGGQVPGPGQMAVIDLPGTYTVEVLEPATVGRLQMPGGEAASTLAVGGTLTLETGGDTGAGSLLLLDGELTTHGALALDGEGRWENGRLAGEGVLQVGGTLTLSGAGVDVRLLDGLAVENRGEINWLYGPLQMVGPEALTNFPEGRLLFQPELGELGWGEGSRPVLDNRGTLVRRGEGPLWVEAELRNSGVVDVAGGWLVLRGPASGDGEVILDNAGAHLEVSRDQARTFAAGSTVRGPGTLTVGGGTLTLEGALDVGRLRVSNGTLVLSGDEVRRAGAVEIDVTTTVTLTGGSVLEATDTARWSGGRVEGDGTLRAAVGASFVMDGSDGRTLGASALLENLGELTSLEGPLFLEGSARVVNRPGATLTLASPSGAFPRGDGGEPSFVNEGRLVVAAGDGWYMDVPLVNRGTVEFQESGIHLRSDLVHEVDGVLAGTGGLSFVDAGAVDLSGTLSPGLSPGFLSFLGTLPLNPSSTVTLEVQGTEVSGNDVIQVEGSAILGGTLELQVAPDLVLEAGQVVPLMAFQGRSGVFDATVGVPAGMEVAVSDTTVVLRLATEAPPDPVKPGVGLLALPRLGAGTAPAAALAVNAVGTVVGWSEQDGERRAAQWPTAAEVGDLGTLGGPGPHQAFDVNRWNQAVGASGKDGVGPVPFLAQEGLMSELTGLAGAPGEARGINDDGMVVGWTRAFGASDRAFTWTNAGGPTDLGALGGTASRAYAVRGDDVVGWAENADGQRRAVLWHLGDPVNLGTLGGAWSEARDVTADGTTVVGFSETADGSVHAFLWNDFMGMVDLGTLGGAESRAYGINGIGGVVGMATLADGTVRAVRWVDGTPVDLGTLDTGGDSEARDISADGTVVGFALDSGGVRTAVIWSGGAG